MTLTFTHYRISADNAFFYTKSYHIFVIFQPIEMKFGMYVQYYHINADNILIEVQILLLVAKCHKRWKKITKCSACHRSFIFWSINMKFGKNVYFSFTKLLFINDFFTKKSIKWKKMQLSRKITKYYQIWKKSLNDGKYPQMSLNINKWDKWY